MNTFEKIYSVLAILFALGLLCVLVFFPELRQLNRLLTASLLGLLVNMGLMFIVLRDIFLRRFSDQNMRYIWLALALLIWPSVIYYLVRHGFRPRN
ncbi:MAG: hypothetical protein ACD_75C01263G0004 [uncultured bacterium]|nr:MAG: hypothetical protein ACD_75C01263G0004 [uncultured bacterium]